MPDGIRMTDQAYVQSRSLHRPLSHYPIVMIHGRGQTAVNFETTPDGRPGWADYFVVEGFIVYLVDQPARGRSAFYPEVHGRGRPPSNTRRVEQHFTAPEVFGLWPQAHLHTQWPGTGQVGDPVFDQFYASQVPSMEDKGDMEQLMRSAGAALLDRIGPAILLTHSQSGPIGWHIVDACPDLVRAIIAIEPDGPPFVDVELVGPPEFLREGEISRPYGITATPIAYDPPITNPQGELPPHCKPRPTTFLWWAVTCNPIRLAAS